MQQQQRAAAAAARGGGRGAAAAARGGSAAAAAANKRAAAAAKIKEVTGDDDFSLSSDDSDDEGPTRLDRRARRAKVDPNKPDEVEDDGDINHVFKIVFMHYAQPKDIDSITETKTVDELNSKRYKNNLKYIKEIYMLLKRMQVPWKMPPAPQFYPRANTLYRQRINQPDYKQLRAIEFLAKRNLYPSKDYKMEEAVELAEQRVIDDFIAEQRSKTVRLDIKQVAGVPQDHHNYCDCNYVWDGKSDYCSGTAAVKENRRLRVTWRCGKDHHFMTPQFEIFVLPPGSSKLTPPS